MIFFILNEMVADKIIIYLISFVAIWFGAGLIVNSIEHLSSKLKLSTFAVSFFILGILTSIPEFAVGLTAISQKNSEIFVGNLLGGIPIIFFFIIPLLAILGNGITLKHDLSSENMKYTLIVIAAPFILITDRQVSIFEGCVLILLYVVLFYFIEKKHGIFDKSNSKVLQLKSYSLMDILKVMAGIGLVFTSGNIIVRDTVYFSEFFHISPYYISLIYLSLGTNLPEISLAIRSVISGKKDVAFGDYMGSAAANTLLFGIFTVLTGGEVVTANNFIFTFFFICIGLTVFYFFSKSNKDISRKEGLLLLCLYIIFVYFEVLKSH